MVGHPNGLLQPWHEAVARASPAGPKIFHELLHHLACFGPVQCWPLGAIDSNSAQVTCLVRVAVIFHLLVLLAWGAFLIVATAQLTCLVPQAKAEPDKQDEEPSKGVELPVLQGSKEQSSFGHFALLLATLLHNVQKLSQEGTQLLHLQLHILVHFHVKVQNSQLKLHDNAQQNWGEKEHLSRGHSPKAYASVWQCCLFYSLLTPQPHRCASPLSSVNISSGVK